MPSDRMMYGGFGKIATSRSKGPGATGSGAVRKKKPLNTGLTARKNTNTFNTSSEWLDPNFNLTAADFGGKNAQAVPFAPGKIGSPVNQRSQLGWAEGEADRWNAHAQRYRTDPAYRKKWDREHGGGFFKTIGNTVQTTFDQLTEPEVLRAAALAAGAYGANALLGGGAGAAGAAANPMGSGFAGTGPQVATTTALNGAPALGSAALGGAAVGGGSNVGEAASSFLGGNGMNALSLGAGLGSAYLANESYGDATDEIRRQFDISRADLAPWREAGVNALNELENFDAQSILDDPMYQLADEETKRAIERAAAARGYNLSTNVLRDLGRGSAALATDYGNNIWNRKAGLAGIGQTATNTGVNLGSNKSNALANLNIGRGGAYNNALQGTLQNLFLANYLGRN